MISRKGMHWLTVAVLALVGLVTVLWRGIAVESAYPVERLCGSFIKAVGRRCKAFSRGVDAIAECERLKREVALNVLARADVARLELENARLRKLLSYTPRQGGIWKPVRILSTGGGASSSRVGRLRLSAGSLAGVRKNAVVVVPSGLVGIVVDVTPHVSTVQPITDPALRVSCVVERPGLEPVRGILSGSRDGILLLRHLSSSEHIDIRSRVVTSGLGGVFPSGIVVGTYLDTIVEKDGGPRVGRLLATTDFMGLEDVFVRCEK